MSLYFPHPTFRVHACSHCSSASATRPEAYRSAATTNASTFRRGKKKDAGVHILVHPYFDHFAACVFLDALRLAERAHFWHDTHDVPPRVNEVFPPVAGARGARGPAPRAKL